MLAAKVFVWRLARGSCVVMGEVGGIRHSHSLSLADDRLLLLSLRRQFLDHFIIFATFNITLFKVFLSVVLLPG